MSTERDSDSSQFPKMYGPPHDWKGKVKADRQICANVSGLCERADSPGQDELRRVLFLINSTVMEGHFREQVTGFGNYSDSMLRYVANTGAI